MKNIDYNYLCVTISNLSGIPIRLYENGELALYHSVVNLPKDPVCVYLDEIMQVTDHIGYFVTKHFHYYGIVNHENVKIVLGPTRLMAGDDQELKELAFRADVSAEDTEAFVSAMKSIIPMPLESILQILCTVNYVASGEKLSLGDVCIYDSDKDHIFISLQAQAATERYDNAYQAENRSLHNTLFIEETLTNIVRNGDTAALAEMVQKVPAVRGGKLAAGQIRQMRNTFIVTATLVSRAAIRGGLNADEALTMSDRYIQHCELIDDIGQITNLQYKMIADYTEKVSRIRMGKTPSKLVKDVSHYIQHHLSEPISTEEMAKSLYLSRSRLSTKFKEQTGETLTDFILKEKTEEAKRLLRYSDKTILAIAFYLGFSSQSHFSRVFKKYANCTPKEYIDKHRN